MTAVFNNITRARSLKTDLNTAFSELAEILVDHAGPFATNCVIGSKWRQVNDVDEFTKDGIKILRHLIVADEPVARFAARMARFIGIAVDKRCHDGTTTSMLLFCRLAMVAIQRLDEDLDNPERYRWWKALHNALDDCLGLLDLIKITEDDLLELATAYGIDTRIEDVRAAIAYHMAMISSKGDHDLSSKISEVIRSSPKKIYGIFKDPGLSLETEERYNLTKQDYDLSVSGNPGHAKIWNYKNDTQFLAEEAVIFATGNEIVSHTFEAMFLRAFISDNPMERANLQDFGVSQSWEELCEGKRHLVIFTPMLNDPELTTDIFEFNRKYPQCKISHFNIQIFDRMRTSFNKAIHYMAGANIFDEVGQENALKSLIGLESRSVSVHCIGHQIQIKGLYQRDGEVFHPFYQNPDAFEPYTKLVKDTEELISFAEDNITNQALNPEEVTYITALYRSLTCQSIYDITVGGLAHEQYANRTVYEDAIGAALSAVNDGVVLGGYGHLAKLFHSRLEPYTDQDKRCSQDSMVSIFMRALGFDKNSTYEDVERALYRELNEALVSIVADSTRYDHDLVSELVSKLDDKWSFIVANTSDFEDGFAPHVDLDRFSRITMLHFLSREEGDPILLQAWAGYHEQFRRFKDILPKLANTTNFSDMRIKETDDVR